MKSVGTRRSTLVRAAIAFLAVASIGCARDLVDGGLFRRDELPTPPANLSEEIRDARNFSSQPDPSIFRDSIFTAPDYRVPSSYR